MKVNDVMRWCAVPLTLLALAGCKKKPVEDPAAEAVAPPAPLLACPGEAMEYGSAPPDGQELWCAITTPTGQVTRHGPARTWYRDGLRKSSGFYDNGRKTGHWWYWHDDGTMVREGDYQDGVEHGHWIIYRADGSIEAEGSMQDGRRHGIWIGYNATTGVANQGLWVDGEQDGIWIEVDENGEPARERLYRRGRLVSIREL